MALKIFQKIINRFSNAEVLDDGDNELVENYYIPSGETLLAVSEMKPLTDEQIEDYIKYIHHNYYLNSLSGDKLISFSSEWIRIKDDLDAIEQRKSKAYMSLVSVLKNGGRINKVDALWLSDKIFVNDQQVDLRRIVTKEVVNGSLSIIMNKNGNDPAVGMQVEEIRTKLSEAKATKEVATIK